MKKVILTIALAAFTFAANAQFIIGGNVGFNTTGGTDNFEANTVAAYDVPLTQTNRLTIAPTISYVINDNMQAGLGISYTLNTTKTFNAASYVLGNEDWQKDRSNTFTIAPYFRYYFANAGDFNFFCEVQAAFSITPRDNTHNYDNTVTPIVDEDVAGATQTTSIGLSIVPGVNYRISEHFSADIYIDLARIGFTHTSTKNYGALTTSGWDNDFLVDTESSNRFNMFANSGAQTIANHLGNFRIGINYHF